MTAAGAPGCGAPAAASHGDATTSCWSRYWLCT